MAAMPDKPWANEDFYLKKGLEGIEHHKFTNGKSFTSVIESRIRELSPGDWKVRQYVVFDSVSERNLAYIERIRDHHYKHLPFMYLPDKDTLIVKTTPGMLHCLVVDDFTVLLREKLAQMGPDCNLANLRTATFKGILGPKKADIALVPRVMETDWPTVVFECGIEESLERLTVNTVLLFSISKTERKIHLEQWELAPVPNPYPRVTRAHPGPTLSPTRVHQVDVLTTGANGAPLTLSFQKIFLRRPDKNRGEGDIVFTEQELQSYATSIWDCACAIYPKIYQNTPPKKQSE
ncbi:hypothetical protein B9Z19DRAFT_1122806 [Tuber borchii]|uniref:Uncharacterized protein n=1 Tax=Tuber borchii TaxID=42251 RepID=A0A2T6ZZK5_TUBBO|nr:hypothetical protein B9Z19DRAFT_1122806 [Tuber borchii]